MPKRAAYQWCRVPAPSAPARCGGRCADYSPSWKKSIRTSRRPCFPPWAMWIPAGCSIRAYWGSYRQSIRRRSFRFSANPEAHPSRWWCILNTMLRIASALVFILFAPALFASGVTVRWDPTNPTTGPYPNDFLTTPDATQKSGRRVNLPMPSDCATALSDCQDVQLIVELDGFQTVPRIAVTFSAPIDVNTLYNAIFYVPLDNQTDEEPGINYFGQKIPINQIIFDPTTNTVYAKPDGNLDQHRHIAIIVTDKIHDLAGDPVEPDADYATCVQLGNNWAQQNWYCNLRSPGVNSVAAEFAPYNVVGASVFTPMNVTSWLESAHAELAHIEQAFRPAPPQVIQYANIASLMLHEQVAATPGQFVDVSLPIDNPLFKGIGALAFG